MTKKTKISLIIAGIIVALAVILVASTAYTVKEDQYGIVRQFGKVVSIKDEAGIYIKIPFMEDVSYLPKNLLVDDVTPSDVLTSDKKALVIDSYVVWKITDPLTFVQSIGTVDEMESRLDAATFSVVKNTMGTMEQTSIIQSGASENSRNEVNGLITEMVNRQVTSEYGVKVMSIEIKKLDLPEDNEAAVYERMISERQQMAAKYIAEGELEASVIRNDTDKQAAIIISEASAEAEKLKGEGEAEYMRIIAEAYATPDQVEFYEFYRSLEAMRIAMETQNGEKRVLILSQDSFIAQMFVGE
jgi:membrane protease subunit HflC